jgi:hypothetical protein
VSSTFAITDIPRFKSIFIQLGSEGHKIRVAGEIHRAVEEIERARPELVIFQNHLSGLAADIVLKHLKGRNGNSRCRYALISQPESFPPEFATQLAGIIDPTLPDEQIKSLIVKLLANQPVAHTFNTLAEPFIQQQIEAKQFANASPDSHTEDELPLLTYSMPRRPNKSIISAFSQHLDTSVDDLHEGSSSSQETAIRNAGFRHVPLAIEDLDPPAPKRNLMLWLSAAVVVIVIIVTVIQNNPKQKQIAIEPARQQGTSVTTQPDIQKPASSQQQPHARLSQLPSFIVRSALDKEYGARNPGWERYLQTNGEFRVFRELDGSIKAFQLIDRSPKGVTETSYNSMLQELTGITSMRPAASEIKDGFEIRRGDLAGIQLVQYRDAKNGKIRGFVLTWP